MNLRCWKEARELVNRVCSQLVAMRYLVGLNKAWKKGRLDKKMSVALVTMLIWMFLSISSTAAMAYTIDGSLSDWGIDISSEGADRINYLDTHLPSGGLDIDYTTEDNTDKYHKWAYVGPLYSYRNLFDAEAIYFDNDQYYAYIAIVQGLPQEGAKAPGNPWFYPGDIAIDADNNLDTGEYGFEHGLDISNKHLYRVTDWEEVFYDDAASSNPWAINSGTEVGSVDFVYSINQNSHYVLEAAIPLSYLGLSADPDDPIYSLNIHWTMECGNDYLTLDADVNPVPEPATVLILASGLIGIMGFGRRKK